jgi:hypothetical protein
LKKGLDVIGDIHGYADELRSLLEDKLDYCLVDGVYKHKNRQVIFIGDFIDRGPKNLEVVEIVRSMTDAGSAQAIMGNHEYNAIGFHSIKLDGGENRKFLREHSSKNIKQHRHFLDEQTRDPVNAGRAIEWFKTLPLFIEQDGLRFVHAAWHQPSIDKIKPLIKSDNSMAEDFLAKSFEEHSAEYKAIEIILKGPERSLPKGSTQFRDKDNNLRSEYRLAWWKKPPVTFDEGAEGVSKEFTYPNLKIPDSAFDGFHNEKENSTVFFGHYWKDGKCEPVSKNSVCVDYSVGCPTGKLTCYRWDGEKTPDADKFISVSRT